MNRILILLINSSLIDSAIERSKKRKKTIIKPSKGPSLKCFVNNTEVKIYPESPRTKKVCYDLGIIK